MIAGGVRWLDGALLGRRIGRWRSRRIEAADRARLTGPATHRIEIFHDKDGANPLAQLADAYGSDKGEVRAHGHPYPWPSHSYTDLYDLLFGHARTAVECVVECGLGTDDPDRASSMGAGGQPGASLRMWRDYFPNAQVVGIDIDASILFEEERIRTFACDQTAPESIGAFRRAAGLDPGTVDLFVDDGLHEFLAGACLFEHAGDLVRPGGLYVIEDVDLADKPAYRDLIARHADTFHGRIANLHRPGPRLSDNALVLLTRRR
jgi:SAM-dependent methyltransferase